MPENHVLTRSFKRGSAPAVVAEDTVAVDSESAIVAVTVSAGESDHFENFQCDISRCQTLLLQSTKDVTIATNAPAAPSGAPDQEIELKANAPEMWCEDDVRTCPITADITSGVYITNAGAADAVVDLIAGHT
jgi:hypothetical protein